MKKIAFAISVAFFALVTGQALAAPGFQLCDVNSKCVILNSDGSILDATDEHTKTNITTGTTTNITGAKFLSSLTINTYVASATIKLYDGLTAVNPFAVITLPSTITSDAPVTLTYDTALTTGLTVVTSGATDITVSTR